jgi:general secretion pathway protein K
MNSSPRHKNQGVALVVALLVVAMVALLATALSSDFLLMFRRVENQLYSEQAYAYLLGAEELARAALLQDLQADGDKRNDNLEEPWAQPQKFPTDYGWITGRVEDLQGRFNLNNVVGEAKSGTTAQYSKSQTQLIRLLQSLDLETPLALDQAQALTEAITDWTDANDEVSGLGGAESEYYAEIEPMQRAANRKLISPSELMLLKGMTPDIYRALAPLVTVWPINGSPLNINTAPPQVLRSLGGPQDMQPLGDSEVNYLLQGRESPKYFIGTSVVENGVLADRKIEQGGVGLAVASDYFLLNTTTEFQGHRYSLHSILHRVADSKPRRVEVISRTFGEW